VFYWSLWPRNPFRMNTSRKLPQVSHFTWVTGNVKLFRIRTYEKMGGRRKKRGPKAFAAGPCKSS